MSPAVLFGKRLGAPPHDHSRRKPRGSCSGSLQTKLRLPNITKETTSFSRFSPTPDCCWTERHRMLVVRCSCCPPLQRSQALSTPALPPFRLCYACFSACCCQVNTSRRCAARLRGDLSDLKIFSPACASAHRSAHIYGSPTRTAAPPSPPSAVEPSSCGGRVGEEQPHVGLSWRLSFLFFGLTSSIHVKSSTSTPHTHPALPRPRPHIRPTTRLRGAPLAPPLRSAPHLSRPPPPFRSAADSRLSASSLTMRTVRR